MIQKAFEIGNSIALTIPKEVGIKPGTRVKFERKKNKLIYELLDISTTIETKRIEETSGAIDFNQDSKSLNKMIKHLRENQYDPKIRLS
ncbi:MAG: AbrB/MazE/SpoVT family DNA-binding domain-containing protein [Patescibacteria group bacterium]